MKKNFLFAVFTVFSLCVNAQFKLTPSAGLMTEDGPYIISRPGTESENYEAARKAVVKTIEGAEITETEYEKAFVVNAKHQKTSKLPGGSAVLDWMIPYKLEIVANEGKILISFSEIGSLDMWRKGSYLLSVHPGTGRNGIAGGRYIFNSKGEVGKGLKPYLSLYEEFANNLVKDIENNL